MKSFQLAALALAALPLCANALTIDFEDTPSYSESVLEFYNGGMNQSGATGPSLGVSFSEAVVSLSNDALGPYYANAPTPGTVMYALDDTAVMNVAMGFTGALSFYYANTPELVTNVDVVKIYDGLNATGNVLASVTLFGNTPLFCTTTAFCRFDLASVAFNGVAYSASFGGDAGNVLFDNITITAVPEPATALMLLGGMLAVAGASRRQAQRG